VPRAVPDALAAADALARRGHRLEAIALLTAANRERRDSGIEERLIHLRYEAFAEIERTGGPAAWPPDPPDRFGDVTGLPEVAAAGLDAETIRSGILRHGALVVRGLVDPARAARLVDDIDRAFEAHDAHLAGAPAGDTATWYTPFDAHGDAIARVRKWVRGGGGVLAVESPRSAFDILEIFDEIGLPDLLHRYFGETAVLSARKWTLRRVPIDSNTNWHQDGAFLGTGLRAINVWLALSHCGDDAPGLDVVPCRFDEVLPTGTEGAMFETSVGPKIVHSAEHPAVIRPVFDVGDALLFDDMFLHRTGVTAGMTRERYAIESWFFAASHYPDGQVPVTL
jgi:Phytanoyl-CoA dioxygenase (PhyH)